MSNLNYMKMKRIASLLSFVFLFIISCKEEEIRLVENKELSLYPISNPLPERINGSGNARIQPTYIDWENVQYLSFKNPNNTIVSVLPPWASGVSADIPEVLRYDYRNINGWELLYHTFDPTQTPVVYHPMLILYNKFRGIIRVFYFNINQPSQGSNYLASAITFDSFNSTPTSQLNFANEFVMANTVKQTAPFFVRANINQLNSGLSQGTWFSFDYEVAYDESIKDMSEDVITLKLKTWAVQNTMVNVNGTIQGTLQGYIQSSGSGISLFNNLISNLSLNSTSVNRNIYANTGEQVKVTLQDKIKTGISNSLASSISSELGKLATQGLNFAISPLSKLFNNIVTTSIDNKERVYLDLSAKVNLQGNLTSESAVYDLPYIVPGTKRDKNISGYAPYYDKTLGLFNINQRPIINVTFTTTGGGRNERVTISEFVLDKNSFNPIFNPEVIDEIVISDVKKEIIWLKEYKGVGEYIENPSPGTLVNITAGNEWYLYEDVFQATGTGPTHANLAVRLSFKVTPTNGAPPIYIVKTIRPQIVRN